MFSYSKILHALVICCFGFCLTACKSDAGKTHAQVSSKTGTKAKVILKPTKGNKVTGTVTFAVVSDGVKVVADIDGLTPGKHGFHVHEFGDCSAPDGSSAGGHFNPTKKDHGAPDTADSDVGDLGNITADANGHAHFERIDKVIALKGENNVIGRSMIVHEKADDFSQPVGNAGGRLACGVIEVVE
jgi:Cu-Zn family superoxide dismutase